MIDMMMLIIIHDDCEDSGCIWFIILWIMINDGSDDADNKDENRNDHNNDNSGHNE